MYQDNHILYQEIVDILTAEMKCAESLFATTKEIQSLIDHDQYEQMKDRLAVRGEVFDMMIALDRQMKTLIRERAPQADTDEWQAVKTMGMKLQELMISIMQMDKTNEHKLAEKQEIMKNELFKLETGKKSVKAYTQAYSKTNSLETSG